ncbi:hypothetical protein, partial [Aeromonas caviae]
PRNPSRSKKRLLKTALRDNYLEKRRGTLCQQGLKPETNLESSHCVGLQLFLGIRVQKLTWRSLSPEPFSVVKSSF